MSCLVAYCIKLKVLKSRVRAITLTDEVVTNPCEQVPNYKNIRLSEKM